MSRTNPLNSQLGAMEGVYLASLYMMQAKEPNGVAADMLPYTVNIKWIVAEMAKKFPQKRWTEKLCSRALVRMRKAGILGKTEKGGNKIELPTFLPDDDVEESCVQVDVKTPPVVQDEPEETDSDQ